MKKTSKQKDFSLVEKVDSVPEIVDLEEVKTKFVSVTNSQRAERHGLLGEFSVDGEYKIKDPTMLQALIAIPKKFQNKTEENIFASVVCDDIVLNFKIKMDISASYCNATLYLIETEMDIDEEAKYVTELASLVEIYSPQFQENIFKLWNIVLEDVTYEKTNYVLEYLLTKKNNVRYTQELSEVLAQLYLVKMLKILDESEELGQKIKLKYKKIIEKFLIKDPSLASNYTFLKEVLDKVMIEENAIKPLLQKHTDLVQVFKGYYEPLDRLKEPIVVVPPKEKKKEEKKEEKKEASSKKSANKSKSDAGGKPFVLDIKKIYKANDYKKGDSATSKNNAQPSAAPIQVAPVQSVSRGARTPEPQNPPKNNRKKPKSRPEPKKEDEVEDIFGKIFSELSEPGLTNTGRESSKGKGTNNIGMEL